MVIKSIYNPKIKLIQKLLQKNKARKESGLFIIEGTREIRRAIECGLKIKQLFQSEANQKPLSINTDSYFLSAKLFQKISYRQNPTGCLAIFAKPSTDIAAIKFNQKSFILVIESPEKPGNVGALLRTADGAGVTSIIITNPNLDLFNPNTIRAAAGTFLARPTYLTDNNQAIALLKQNRIKIITTSPAAQKNYYQIDYTLPCAIIAGREDQGLSADWLDNADINIKIPMNGIGDSLNLSVATGIILYEAIHQNTPTKFR